MAKPVAKGQSEPVAAPEKLRLRAVAGYFAESTSGDADRLIYDRVRLGIMSALSVNASMSFAELKELLKTTDGNLSVHARKLEDGLRRVQEKVLCARPEDGVQPHGQGSPHVYPSSPAP